jgi:hypothetical protein
MQQHARQLFERVRIYLQKTAIDFDSGFKFPNIARFVVGFLDEQVKRAPPGEVSVDFDLRVLWEDDLTGDYSLA